MSAGGTHARARFWIRYALSLLRSRNGHHEFEHLCRDFVRARISQNVLPATGPVGAGGDQGRDFETFYSDMAGPPATALGSSGAIACSCTLQFDGVQAKIKEDVGKIARGRPVAAVYAFCESDLPVGHRHELIAWARTAHGLELEIIDGNALAELLAEPNLFWIVEQYLYIPAELLHQDRAESNDAHAWAASVSPDYPRPELHRYLQATRSAAGEHSYSFRSGLSLAQTPVLRDVYVDQDLIEWTERNEGEGGDAGTPISFTWRQLLDRRRHLLLTAGPGTGKSSLLRHIADTLASDWLAGRHAPYVPVRLHARAFAEDKPLAEAIRDGVTTALGFRLFGELPLRFFQTAALPNVPWLVLVDGLDEIQDMNRRETALQAIMEGTTHPDWRFIVTSRPLPVGDVKAARTVLTACELQPFDDKNLFTFAERWFTRLNLHSARGLADRLQTHVQHKDLRRLGHTPLAAAMLCVLLTEAPEQPLPDNRTVLYERYIDLVHRSGGVPVEPMERALQDRSLLLLEDLAYRSHLGEFDTSSLLSMALKWAAENGLAPGLGGLHTWERIVHDVLCGTGLVVSSSGAVEFAHQAFEEYLAARYVVRVITPMTDAERRDTLKLLIQDLANFDAETFSQLPLLLCGIWAARGHPLDFLAATLTSELWRDGPSLVVDLLAEGLPLGAETVTVLRNLATDDWYAAEDADRVTAADVLGELDYDASIDILLAMVADIDIADGGDRVTAIRALLARDKPAVTAAVIKLVNWADSRYWEIPHQVNAHGLVTGRVMKEEERLGGLSLILENPYQRDIDRVHAGVLLVEAQGDAAYHRLKKATLEGRLTWIIGEVFHYRRCDETFAVLYRMVEDPELDFDVRFSAADEIQERFGNDCAASAFRDLAEDCCLDREHRIKAIRELAEIKCEPSSVALPSLLQQLGLDDID